MVNKIKSNQTRFKEWKKGTGDLQWCNEKIKELEAKLEEKNKELEEVIEEKEILQEEIDTSIPFNQIDMEKRLAEKDELYFKSDAENIKLKELLKEKDKIIENIKENSRRIENRSKEIVNDYQKETFELRKQLAERNEELKSLNREIEEERQTIPLITYSKDEFNKALADQKLKVLEIVEKDREQAFKEAWYIREAALRSIKERIEKEA